MAMKSAKKASSIKKFRKGDDVIVIAGRDKGKKGSILRVIPKEERVLVQGVNVVKRHTRPSATNPGGIVDKEAPIHVSNVAHMDPVGGKATRVGFRTLDDSRKVRVARRSGEMID
jgi:large subunit ribosomal protein L24